MWDFYTLSSELEAVGFENIKRMSFDCSDIPDFPLVPLDMTDDNQPRKGYGSMFLEATK
jgi:hypothetical protein